MDDKTKLRIVREEKWERKEYIATRDSDLITNIKFRLHMQVDVVLSMSQIFYYINQSHNPSFSIGLVKTKSDFIVRSVETGLGR